jgi:hypothetical protein
MKNIPTGEYSIDYIADAIRLHDAILQAVAYKHRYHASEEALNNDILSVVRRYVTDPYIHGKPYPAIKNGIIRPAKS